MPEPISEPEIAQVEQALADIASQFDNERLPDAKAFNPWIVAIVVTIGTFMEVLDASIANVALPHIAGSLSASLCSASTSPLQTALCSSTSPGRRLLQAISRIIATLPWRTSTKPCNARRCCSRIWISSGLLCGIILCSLPLVFFLKRPAAQKHVELDVH